MEPRERKRTRSRLMQSTVAVAALKLIANTRLRRVRGWSGLARVRPPVCLDRAVRAGRRGDRRANRPQRVLAVHCHQFLASAFAALAVAWSIATIIDIRTRRIPNALTASMAGAGIRVCGRGTQRCLADGCGGGFVLGLVLMLPGHLLGATGAGDVKLMAAVGAIVGPQLWSKRFCSRRSRAACSRSSSPRDAEAAGGPHSAARRE